MTKTEIITIAIVWVFIGITTSIACYRAGLKDGAMKEKKMQLNESMKPILPKHDLIQAWNNRNKI